MGTYIHNYTDSDFKGRWNKSGSYRKFSGIRFPNHCGNGEFDIATCAHILNPLNNEKTGA